MFQRHYLEADSSYLNVEDGDRFCYIAWPKVQKMARHVGRMTMFLFGCGELALVHEQDAPNLVYCGFEYPTSCAGSLEYAERVTRNTRLKVTLVSKCLPDYVTVQEYVEVFELFFLVRNISRKKAAFTSTSPSIRSRSVLRCSVSRSMIPRQKLATR